MDRAGRIDVLVNNAGFGISGAVEFTDTAEAQRLLDVNFFGMVRMNKAVIPHMRQAGRGRIVNLSSVAAPCPIPFQAYYSGRKGGGERLYHGPGQRAAALWHHGVRRAAWGHSHGLHRRPGENHGGRQTCTGGRIGRSVQRMEHDEQNGMDPPRPERLLPGWP